jgi:DNA-directed RNA polymerase subunit L
MTIVKNITKTAYPIPDSTLDLCKALGVSKYVSPTVPQGLVFELHETTTELANGLRRCMEGEIPVLIMTFSDESLSTNDDFIITHELKKRIGLIPIRQISGVDLRINVTNNTDEIIPVYSGQIMEAKKLKEPMFSSSFILCHLRPGKSLLIDGIYTRSGVKYKNGAAHSFPGKIGYSCLDLEDAPEGNGGKTPVSSMNSDPSTYMLTIHRQKYIDPAYIVKLALVTLSEKFDKIRKIVEDATDNFYSSEMEIVYSEDMVMFKIFNETYTVGNMIVKYGMLADKTITNINCKKLHPSFDYINIEIRHPDPRSIMLQSIESIQEELKKIGGFF